MNADTGLSESMPQQAGQHDDRILNALSFDIEDWFHLVAIKSVADPDLWPSLDSLVEKRTDELLQICADVDVRATFFILGWIAERYPSLVKRIADAGHDLGTHSYWHRTVFSLTPDEFREDMRRSIDVIANAGGCAVVGFRAPSFSITPGTEWAMDVLLDCGITYDASLFPAARGHGGYPCPRGAHMFTAAPSGRQMPELPMSVMKVGPKHVAFSGGGYLRVLPEWLIHRGFEQCHRLGMSAVVYIHPRDIAPDCPVVPMSPIRRFKSYVGLSTAANKLKRLLTQYRFGTCEEVLASSLDGFRAEEKS